jgi:D-alanyl-D-alanine carboxypeptidase
MKTKTIHKALLIGLSILSFLFHFPFIYADEPPVIESPVALLMDAKTGLVLYEKDGYASHYPASITKLMTTLLVIENLKPSDVITFSQDAIYSIERGSSHIGMQIGEQITVDQALHGLLLMSANEVGAGLAEKISGSVSEFASLMNLRAARIGARNTHFTNPHGLHNVDHYTTAYDMALITRELYTNPYFLEIMSHATYQIPPTNRVDEIRYLSQQHPFMNKLRNSVLYRSDVIAGKTGYTDQARHTLVTVGKRGDIELIAVIMQSERNILYEDTNRLLDYGFDSYTQVKLYDPSDILTVLPMYSVRSGGLYEVASCTIGVASSQSILLSSSIKQRDLITNLTLPEYIEIGTTSGDIVGSIEYTHNGKVLAKDDLIVKNVGFISSPFEASLPNEDSVRYGKYSRYALIGFVGLFIVLALLLTMYRQYKKRNRYKKLSFSKTAK